MHDGRTCKVVENFSESPHHEAVGSIVAEPSAAPSPMAFDGVDEQRNASAINDVHREFCALCHRSADNRRRGGAEDGLEDEEALDGQLAFIEREVAKIGRTNEACSFTSKHESEAHKPEQ